MQYNKGDEVYYITFFRTLKKCTIIDRRSIRTLYGSWGYFSTSYEYIVRFENGKEKIVNEDKIF